MFTAQKVNRVLKIDELKADEYVAMGYTVRDKDGNLIGAPVTADSLKEQLDKANKRIAELEAQLGEKSSKKADGKKADAKKDDAEKEETKKAE